MSDTIVTQRGQTLALAITFYEADASGAALNLTGATVTVRESFPPVLGEAAIAITDAADGECSLSMTEVQVEKLGDGRVNWFRLEAQFSGGDNRVTPQIWINVQ
jgi:hypothetical protein